MKQQSSTYKPNYLSLYLWNEIVMRLFLLKSRRWN